jgi:hypothetical protein
MNIQYVSYMCIVSAYRCTHTHTHINMSTSGGQGKLGPSKFPSSLAHLFCEEGISQAA